MNNLDAIPATWSKEYKTAIVGIDTTRQMYTEHDFLKEFCGGMSMEILQQILHEHAPEYLI